MQGNQIKKLKVVFSQDYTPLRKLYAWVGFAALAAGIAFAAYQLFEWHAWAVAFINS